MFWQRALITFTLGPLALYLVYLGGWFYFIPLTAILIMATHEYVHLLRRLDWHLSFGIMVTAVFIQLAIGQWCLPELFAPALLISSLVILGYSLWQYEKKKSQTTLANWMAMTSGVLILGWIGSHFFLLRRVENSAWQWTMLALLSTWIADSGAYTVGKFLAGSIISRHRLSPRLSPNKTVEGYFGGVIIGTLLSATIGKILGLPLPASVGIGLFASTISPLGDLGISMIKRKVGVKDSGVLFPGHGGALDRIDSLIWSVAITYYLALFLG